MNIKELIYHLNDIRLQLNDGTHGPIQGEILHLMDQLGRERDIEPNIAPNRLKLVQETVHSIMSTSTSDSIKDKCFRNAARFIQSAIDGSDPDFEVIPDSVSEGPVWIPVSEKLPPHEGWFYITYAIQPSLAMSRELYFKNGRWLDNIRVDMCDTYDVMGFGKSFVRHKLTPNELDCDWTPVVVAWMELPQPYDKAVPPERSVSLIKIKSLPEIQAELDHGRAYLIDDFTEMVEDGTITEDDGLGYFHDGVHAVCNVFEQDEYNIVEAKEKNAKYAIWYNK